MLDDGRNSFLTEGTSAAGDGTVHFNLARACSAIQEKKIVKSEVKIQVGTLNYFELIRKQWRVESIG